MMDNSTSRGVVEESVFVVYDEAAHTYRKHKLRINWRWGI